MALTYYPEVFAFSDFDWGDLTGSSSGTEVSTTVYPYASFNGSMLSGYTNKVWDTVAGGWVFWNTDFEDLNGIFYPGPGVFGVNTSQYRVEAINFYEEQ